MHVKRALMGATLAAVLAPLTMASDCQTANVDTASGGSAGTSNKANRKLGKRMAKEKGWTGSQWRCLNKLWNGESGWSQHAHNSSSGAHGIPQALPASKMRSAGRNYMTSPRVQIKWGLGYIGTRYGTPCQAWNKWLARSPHWY
jgi:hypothetical protein